MSNRATGRFAFGVGAILTTSLDFVPNESEAVATFVSLNPGRDVQKVGTAAFLGEDVGKIHDPCLLYTSPSPRDRQKSRMPSSA